MITMISLITMITITAFYTIFMIASKSKFKFPKKDT
jgi:hypothetical protein